MAGSRTARSQSPSSRPPASEFGVSRLGCDPSERVACVVCGSSASDVLCTRQEIEAQRRYVLGFHRRRLKADIPRDSERLIDRALFTQDCPAELVVCRGCALVCRKPQPQEQLVERAYEGDRYGVAQLDAAFEAQYGTARAKAATLQRWLPMGASVVEVGSFVGGFLVAGQERGWRMLGIDPGEDVTRYCTSRGLAVMRSTLEEAGLPSVTADAVVIWNTFDQLPDPRPTVAAASHLLKPGGLLVIRVPNGTCYRLTVHALRRLPRALRPLVLAGLAWNNLLAFPYLYGYGAGTLDRLLEPFRFCRIYAEADVLVRLADASTKRWAVWEERLVKAMWRAFMAKRLHGPPGGRDRGLARAPWLDLYYRYAA